jgi:hypothetical protein
MRLKHCACAVPQSSLGSGVSVIRRSPSTMLRIGEEPAKSQKIFRASVCIHPRGLPCAEVVGWFSERRQGFRDHPGAVPGLTSIHLKIISLRPAETVVRTIEVDSHLTERNRSSANDVP